MPGNRGLFFVILQLLYFSDGHSDWDLLFLWILYSLS